MRTLVDAVLRDEAARFALRFACEDCAHFGTNSAGVITCGNGWPEGVAADALRGDGVTFCKEFEIGGEPQTRTDGG